MSSFGRYEILEKLGAGGMAEVYLARAYGADGFVKDLVLKKVLANRAEDTQFRKMFVEEAKITVSLSHTNIVQVFDFGKVDETYFLAMERVHGSDLRKVLGRLEGERRRLPVPVALHVMTEVLKGLDYAHRRTTPDGKPLGIVHRDVSPSNILLSYEGEVKLADFGIARAARNEPEDGASSTVIGKPRYMAPEQIRGEAVDARADVFACGVVLAEMLLGEQPFATSDDMDTFAMVLTGTTVKPLDARSGLPPDLVPVVRRAMAMDPGQRFASAAAFGKALEDYALDRRIRLSGATLSELLHSLQPPDVTLARRDPGPTRDAPTIFERVSAGPGEVAHSPAQFDASKAAAAAAAGAVATRSPTAKVEVSIARRAWRRPAPVALAGLAVLALVAVVGDQVGIFGGDLEQPSPGASATPIAARSATPAPPVSATPEPTAGASHLADRPTPAPLKTRTGPHRTPRATATPVAATPTATPATVLAAKAPGWLALNSFPWGHVTIDGKAKGSTPIKRLELPPGRYEVKIRNPDSGKSATLTVVIEPGKETRHGVELR